MIEIIIVILIIIILYYFYKKENFAPYYQINIPYIINSTAGFDEPNQYGWIGNPYYKQNIESADKLFDQTHALYI